MFFSYRPWFGALILAISFFHPPAGIGGLLGVMIANATALFMRYNHEHIQNGFYGLNALLVGMEIAYFYKLNLSSIFLLVILIVATVFLTSALNYIYRTYLGIPAFSLPFVLITIVLHFSIYYNHTSLSLRDPIELALQPLSYNLWKPVLLYFQSLGIILFQTNILAGIAIAILLFVYSRILFILSFCGFMAGFGFCHFLGICLSGPENAFIGFNFIFISIAVGGIFFIPSFSSFCLAMASALFTILIASAIKAMTLFSQMPISTLPYNLVMFVLLLSFKQRGLDRYPKMTDFVPGRPEDNLNYYLKNIRRFSPDMLCNHLYLPFRGKWVVSQGVEGKHTHKNDWKWALDFQMLTSAGKTFEKEGNRQEEYPTFGASIYAPLGGQVIAIENSIPDNEIGKINSINNWGNYIILYVTYGVYIKLAHFQKGSIPLVLNQYIKRGDYIGKAGNSGRSPYPHLHLQVQSLPGVGSNTIPFRFNHYVQEQPEGKEIFLQKLPCEGSVLQSIEIDEKFQETFHLYVNRSLEYKKNGVLEKISSKVNFYNKTYLESDLGAKLYFVSDSYFFYLLDFEGNTNSCLYDFYKNLPRVPFFHESDLKWQENVYYPRQGMAKVWDDFRYFFWPASCQKRNMEFGKKVRYSEKICYTIKNDDAKIYLHPKYFIVKFTKKDTSIEQIHPDLPLESAQT